MVNVKALLLCTICPFSFGLVKMSINARLNARLNRLYAHTNCEGDKLAIIQRAASKICSTALLLFSMINSPVAAEALTFPLDNPVYHKAFYDIPSDDFWYPPYMIGRWDTTLKFRGATFTDKIPLDTLSKDDNLPGFSKYSVIFAPEIGKDIESVELR